MLKKNIVYKDYDGKERNEDHYFNLDEGEIMEMEMSVSGGFSTMVEKIINEQNEPELFKVFKDFVVKSYGEKSGDGKYFLKEDDNGRPLVRKFLQSKAYSALMLELTHDGKAASDFISSLIPADMAEKYNSLLPQPTSNTAN